MQFLRRRANASISCRFTLNSFKLATDYTDYTDLNPLNPCNPWLISSPMQILVVEDDFDARQMLQVLLQLEGHSVVTAVNGNEGWATFLKGRFSVVLSDWLMPESDGLDLCR